MIAMDRETGHEKAHEPLHTRLRQALLACACGAVLVLSGASAMAQQADEDEDTFEQKIIKNILGGLGVDVGRNNGIEYRERSPLVIPPSLDLPPPEGSDLAARNPSWPREPERKKSVSANKQPLKRAGAEDPGQHAAMTPDELRRGANPRAPRITDPSQSGSSVSDSHEGRPLSPRELGSSSIFNWRALTGSYAPEEAKFEGEPGRGTLTQPPAGYQTPSSSQPYGIGQEKGGGWKIPTILDRPVGQER